MSDDDQALCVICLENERETYLEPCGHIVVCESCSENLAKDPNPNNRENCVYCRRPIDNIAYIKTCKTVSVIKDIKGINK